MPRTTLDIDATVLRELKRRAHTEGTTVGRLVSRLLAISLREKGGRTPSPLEWRTAPMHARVDLRDKDALNRFLDDR